MVSLQHYGAVKVYLRDHLVKPHHFKIEETETEMQWTAPSH